MRKTITLMLNLIESTNPELMLLYFGIIQFAQLILALLSLRLLVAISVLRMLRTT